MDAAAGETSTRGSGEAGGGGNRGALGGCAPVSSTVRMARGTWRCGHVECQVTRYAEAWDKDHLGVMVTAFVCSIVYDRLCPWNRS